MATFEERIYSLGVDALAEQERQVAEVRGRASVLLAAGAVVPSLLAKSVFHGDHPEGFLEIAAAAVGLIGAAGVLVFTVLLLRPNELGFSMKAGETYRELWNHQILDQPMIDLALAEALDERRQENAKTVKQLVLWLGLALGSLVVETAGLALAAALTNLLGTMATPNQKSQPTPPPQPKVPAPGSVPKLPQTIFNLEKRGGSGNSGSGRRQSRS